MTTGSIPGRLGLAERRVVGLPLRGVRAAWARPELLLALAVAASLNLWGLSRNGWANTFYAGAVRSMASSWHDFVFASLDRSGLMTVDKPPLAFWIQALSVRIFGWHSLSILIPQALMGVATVGLTYDLVRRRFGRAAGFAAALALALTPMTVAISRHNNPDQALILCCVAALWFAVRALEDGRVRWLVWSGVCVGLGFEAKMSVALFVVPGIALAWLWGAPVPSIAVRVRRLLYGGVAMAAVGLAWPLVLTFTPAADRPWISGTSDNSVWSLIVNYNGVGRVAGQAGAPMTGGGGGGGGFSSGATGPLRLLDSALGGQAGWLLGFAVVSALGIVALTRLRRLDARSGWLVAVGGAFAVSAVVFSVSSGIVHPYYVSFLAPWTAMLVGAGVGEALRPGVRARALGAAAVLAGAVSELVVVGGISGSVAWATPLVIVACSASVLALLVVASSTRVRAVAVAVALAALLAAPGAWAVDTLGHATSATFPAGGPGSATVGGGPGGGLGGFGGFGRGSNAGGAGVPGAGGSGLPGASGAGVPGASGAGLPGASGAGLPGAGGSGVPGASGSGVPGAGGAGSGGGSSSGVPGMSGAPGVSGVPGISGARGGHGAPGAGAGSTGAAGGAGGGFPDGGGMFGGDSSTVKAASRYAASHGGGTVAVESQSSAASAIVDGQGNIAGIGGFSGRESTVSASWLAMEVRDGHLRWILADTGGFGGAVGGSGGSGGAVSGGSGMAGVSGGVGTAGVSGGVGTAGVSGGSGGGSAAGSGVGSLFGTGGSGQGGVGSGGSAPFGTGGGSSGGTGPSGGTRASGGGGPGFSDGRNGSKKVFTIAAKVGRKVTFKVNGRTVTMYDLKGKAAAILAAAKST